METMGTTGVVQNVQEEIKKKMTVKSQTMCFCDTELGCLLMNTRFLWRMKGF